MASQTRDYEKNCYTDRLRIEVLRDPVIEAVGHQPTSPYSRRYYLPLIGPSSFLCAEILTGGLNDRPGGYEVEVAFLGAVLGLPGTAGRSSSIARTLNRLIRFGLARHHPAQALYRVRLRGHHSPGDNWRTCRRHWRRSTRAPDLSPGQRRGAGCNRGKDGRG